MRTVRSTRRVVSPPQLDQEGPGRDTPIAALAEPAVPFLPRRQSELVSARQARECEPSTSRRRA